MNKNQKKTIELEYKIMLTGNWNYQNQYTPIYTKPIGVIFLDEDKFVFRHKEILKLIKCYHDADITSVEMIKNKQAGAITKPETLFIDKIQYYIDNLRKEIKQT